MNENMQQHRTIWVQLNAADKN